MKKFLASLIQTGEPDNVRLAKALTGGYSFGREVNDLIPHLCWKYAYSGWSGPMQRPYICLEKPGGVSGLLQKHILV